MLQLGTRPLIVSCVRQVDIVVVLGLLVQVCWGSCHFRGVKASLVKSSASFASGLGHRRGVGEKSREGWRGVCSWYILVFLVVAM